MHSLDQAARNAIAAHYAQRRHRLYARWKLASDPVYATTAELLGDPRLPLLDAGCGIGLLAQYLRAAGTSIDYAGIDHDPRKIATAQSAAHYAGLGRALRLHCADVATLPPTRSHVVLLGRLPAGRPPTGPAGGARATPRR